MLPGLRASLSDPSGTLDRDSCQGFNGAYRKDGPGQSAGLAVKLRLVMRARTAPVLWVKSTARRNQQEKQNCRKCRRSTADDRIRHLP